MPEGAVLGGLLVCALFIGLAIETLIGAVFLRRAVALYNNLAGGASSPSSVPEPAYGKAMWIIFSSTVFQLVVGGLFIAFTTDAGSVAAGPDGKGVNGVAQLISFPVGFLIMAAVLSAKLPTTFGNAILVTVCYLLLVLLVVGALVGIAVLVFGVAFQPLWPPSGPSTSKGP